MTTGSRVSVLWRKAVRSVFGDIHTSGELVVRRSSEQVLTELGAILSERIAKPSATIHLLPQRPAEPLNLRLDRERRAATAG